MAAKYASTRGLLLSAQQMRFFCDEACKLAGLPRPPASVGPLKLLSGSLKPTLPGTSSVAAKLSKATSPAAIVPPPPISA